MIWPPITEAMRKRLFDCAWNDEQHVRGAVDLRVFGDMVKIGLVTLVKTKTYRGAAVTVFRATDHGITRARLEAEAIDRRRKLRPEFPGSLVNFLGEWLDAQPCAFCGCDPDATPRVRCTIDLDDDLGRATCVPAGVFDSPFCSKCVRDVDAGAARLEFRKVTIQC